MALSWNIETTESIAYEEFLEYFKSLGPRLLQEDLDQSALVMRKLANNRDFLTEQLNRQLKNLKTFQSHNLYTPQVFILYAEETFFIRANVWEPAERRPEESLFFYGMPHDHNFTFLTVGYYGSGYRTKIYDYDYASVIGYAREPVALRFLEETTLPFGKVMLFRESIDIHCQMAPVDLSISLNVLKQPGARRPDQYSFDLEKGELVGKADKLPISVVIRLAGALANENTVDVLTDLVKSHPNRRARLNAYEALAQRQGTTVWEQALGDEDTLIRTVAQQKLEQAPPSLRPRRAATSAEGRDPAPDVECANRHAL